METHCSLLCIYVLLYRMETSLAHQENVQSIDQAPLLWVIQTHDKHFEGKHMRLKSVASVYAIFYPGKNVIVVLNTWLVPLIVSSISSIETRL